MECFKVEKAVIERKEIMACTYKHDNSCIGVIIFEKKVGTNRLIIAKILLFMRSSDVTLL